MMYKYLRHTGIKSELPVLRLLETEVNLQFLFEIMSDAKFDAAFAKGDADGSGGISKFKWF